MAEYNASGSLLNRYIHGAGNDDPLVWYSGTGTSNKRYLLADERGSIVSETNATGSVVATHRYGPYGEPINQSTSRFRYTGQILIPGTELYHYKARVYHPKLGRFMQTDPIGYEDGMNWYAYGGNDPVNLVDPGGKTAESFFVQGKTYENVGQAVSGAWGDLKSSLDKDTQSASREIANTMGENAGDLGTVVGMFPHPGAQLVAAELNIIGDLHNNSTAGTSGSVASALVDAAITDIASDGGKKVLPGPVKMVAHAASVAAGLLVSEQQTKNEIHKVDNPKVKNEKQ